MIQHQSADAILNGYRIKNQGREKEILWDMIAKEQPELIERAIDICDMELEQEINQSRYTGKGR